MPPRSRARPDADRQKAFVEGLARSIVAAERAALAGEGRAIRRRLNRYEYENTLRDLLDVPWIQVEKDRLPEDGEPYRFNKIGEALDVSHVQLARYLDTASYAMHQAMTSQFKRPAKTTRNLRPREGPTQMVRAKTDPARPAVIPRAGPPAQPDVRAVVPRDRPDTREREPWARCRAFSASGRLQLEGRARRSRHNTGCVTGYTIWVGGGGLADGFTRAGGRKAPVYQPLCGTVQTWRKSGPAGGTNHRGLCTSDGQNRLGEVDFSPRPTVHEIQVYLLRTKSCGPTDEALPHAHQRHGRTIRQPPGGRGRNARLRNSVDGSGRTATTKTQGAGRAIVKCLVTCR